MSTDKYTILHEINPGRECTICQSALLESKSSEVRVPIGAIFNTTLATSHIVLLQLLLFGFTLILLLSIFYGI